VTPTATSNRVVNALKRLTKEVGYMLEMDTDETKDLIISSESRLALEEAEKALKEIGETIEYDDD
jgi:transcriptional regulator of NAD metabolism